MNKNQEIYLNVLLISGIILNWYVPNPDRDIKGFSFYYRVENSEIKLLAKIDDPFLRSYYFKDFNVISKFNYTFYVSSRDSAGNESEKGSTSLPAKKSILNKLLKWRK